MKIKTSELIDVALDWAVAKCEDALHPLGNVVIEGRSLWLDIGGQAHVYMEEDVQYAPSDDWAQGGPIIERSNTHIWTDRKDAAYMGHPDSYWVAEMTEIGGIWWGPTPLIAALRCYVASKLGDEIDIPEELSIIPPLQNTQTK